MKSGFKHIGNHLDSKFKMPDVEKSKRLQTIRNATHLGIVDLVEMLLLLCKTRWPSDKEGVEKGYRTE